MKDSEIRRALKKIDAELCITQSYIDKKETDPQIWSKESEELKKALDHVKTLCDYMIDNGVKDLSERLLTIKNRANNIVHNFPLHHICVEQLMSEILLMDITHEIREWFADFKTIGSNTEDVKDLHYYCKIAIEKGYLIKCEDGGYKRASISKSQLAYFLKHFPEQDGTFPDQKYCVLFHESRLSKAADQLINNRKTPGKPRGYKIIDELLSM